MLKRNKAGVLSDPELKHLFRDFSPNSCKDPCGPACFIRRGRPRCQHGSADAVGSARPRPPIVYVGGPDVNMDVHAAASLLHAAGQASVDAAPEGWSQAAVPDAVDEAYSPGASGSTSTCQAAVPPGGGLVGLSPLDRCLRLSESGEASEEINALLRQRRFLLDARASMDHQLWEARVHLTSASLGWMGRGAGRRPVCFADCHGEGVARPLEGEAPACSAPAAAGATPAVGRVVHARAYGRWRPAMVVQQGADPGIVVVRWWHDARLCVLSVGGIVVTPASVQYDACTGPVPRMGGPPLCVGQAVYALFHGEWFPAVIRRFLPEAGGVQVVWTGEFSKSNVPLQDVRTVPAWMLDSTTVDDPDLRVWLEELTGRWPPWTAVAVPAGSIPEDPAAEEASSFMFRPI